MNRRTVAIALVAGALVAATPAFAAASLPLPDPPPRLPLSADRDAALDHLTTAYRGATVAEKHELHSEIVMLRHHPREGWTI